MELYELTVHELLEKLDNKEITLEDITKSYIDRINDKEKDVQAFVTLTDKEALEKVQTIKERKTKFEGIPIGIKDNMCTKGTKTTCSSKMLENFIAPYDATVIEKLNEEGLVSLGKLNMDEFAMGASTEYSAFKITKPTYGLVSRYGLVAYASSLDQIGPITKDVEDSAMLLNIITGYDEKDSTSAKVDKKDYTKALVKDVKGLKIGVPKEYFGEGINEEVKKSVKEAVKKYEEMGAIIEECSLDIADEALAVYYIIACAEASSNLGRFDGIRYGYRTKKFESLKDIYVNSRTEGFGDEVKRRIILGTYVLSSGYYDAYYKKAQKVRTIIRDEFAKLFEKYDVLLTPTSPSVAYEIGTKSSNPLEMYLADLCTVTLNIAGLPGISIPCGVDSKGMPIGMQLIGKHFDEETIIRAAYTYEQETKFRENYKPEFKM